MSKKGASSKDKKGLSLALWFQWLLSGEETPPPGNTPARPILDFIAAIPPSLLPQVSQRLLFGFRYLLQNKRKLSGRTAKLWMDIISSFSKRWLESPPAGSTELLPRAVTEFTIYSFSFKKKGLEPGNLVSLLASFIQKDNGLAKGVLDSLEASLNKQEVNKEAYKVLHFLAQRLPKVTRLIFWQQLLTALLAKGASKQSRWVLEAIDHSERAQLLEQLLLIGAEGCISPTDVIEHLERELQETSNHFIFWKPLLKAAVLLENVPQTVSLHLEHLFKRAIEERTTIPSEPTLERLVKVANQQISQMRDKLEQNYRAKIHSLETQLARLETELERTRQQMEALHDKLAQQQEMARLDLLRDILLAIGETLQILTNKEIDSSIRLRDVEAGLKIALQAGGAEPIGQVGEEVFFDYRLHNAGEPLEQNTRVIITSPGVLVRGRHLGDLVLLKARVLRKER
jgi:molecular chaperone GrpE (heat shock protein)